MHFYEPETVATAEEDDLLLLIFDGQGLFQDIYGQHIEADKAATYKMLPKQLTDSAKSIVEVTKSLLGFAEGVTGINIIIAVISKATLDKIWTMINV